MIEVRHKTFGRALFWGTSFALPLALFLAFLVRFRLLDAPKGIPPIVLYLPFFSLILGLHLFVFSLQGYFQFKLKRGLLDSLFAILFNFVVTLVISLGFFSYLRGYRIIRYEISHLFLLVYFFLGVLFALAAKAAVGHLLMMSFQAPHNRRRGIIVGATSTGIQLAEKLARYRDWGVDLCGFIDEEREVGEEILPGLPVLGRIGDLEELFLNEKVHDLFITLPLKEYDRLLEIIKVANRHLASIRIVPDLLHFLSLRAELEHIEEIPIINLNDIPLKGWKAVTKRLLDIGISAAALFVLSPILFAAALLVKLTSRGPLLYLQERVGIDGKAFRIYKFRTMVPDAEAATGPVWASAKNDPRTTPIGRVLRKYSIDELPQLANVLRGEMSLVGPRPERPYFVEKFRDDLPQYMLRHKVKAGMTGWAQVNGLRGNTSLKERLRYDLYYIENWSLALDAKILWMTVWRLGFIDPNL